MIVAASITIYAVPTPQPATYTDVICQPDAVSVDCNNVQSLPLGVKVVKRVGGALEEQKAYVRIRVFAGEVELGVADSGGKVSEWGYFLPADKWGNADMLAVEVHGNAGYTDLLAEKKVSILRQNAVPFPIEGEWKPLPFRYKNGEYFIDPVHNLVFQWGNPVPGNSEIHPFEDMKQRPQETSWRKYSDWTLLATQVFLANWAKLGSAVFSGDHMMSQHGRNAAGETDSDYRKFDAEKLGQPDCPFTPNILLNFLTGAAHFAQGNARFNEDGGVDIRGRLEAVSKDGNNKVVVNPEKGEFNLYRKAAQGDEWSLVATLGNEYNSVNKESRPILTLGKVSSGDVYNAMLRDNVLQLLINDKSGLYKMVETAKKVEVERYNSISGGDTRSASFSADGMEFTSYSNGSISDENLKEGVSLNSEGLTFFSRDAYGKRVTKSIYPRQHKVVALTGGDYNVGTDDFFIRPINGTNNVYLPPASTYPGRVIYFKKTSGGDYTYLKVGSNVNGGIKDENNSTSVKQYEINQNVALFVVSDATDWIVFYCG